MMDLVEVGARLLTTFQRVQNSLGDRLSNAAIEERLARVSTNLGPYGVDGFGFDPAALRRVLPSAAWMYRRYFRVATTGAHRIPEGRCMLIANHSGQLPFDAAMIIMAAFLEREPPRMVRSMVERFVPNTPFVSPILARLGQVLGTPANCRRLLEAEELIQIFPEGVRGLNKTFRRRYQLARFGHGFMRLAIQMQCPIVPVTVIGAEEQAPSLMNLRPVARFLGLPSFPLTVTPGFGLFPLPTRYRIAFGEPMYFGGHANDEEAVISRKVHQVRAVMREMLRDGIAARKHIFW